MTNNKFFKGNGFLTEEGERFLMEFNYALENIATSDDLRNMTVGEVHTLQANLAKKVGDAISKHLARRLQEANLLAEMSDKEVDKYLTDKYGKIWPELTLTLEEQVRVHSLRNKKRK